MDKHKLGLIILGIVLLIYILLNATAAGVAKQDAESSKKYIETLCALNIVLFTPVMIYATTMICRETS